MSRLTGNIVGGFFLQVETHLSFEAFAATEYSMKCSRADSYVKM